MPDTFLGTFHDFSLNSQKSHGAITLILQVKKIGSLFKWLVPDGTESAGGRVGICLSFPEASVFCLHLGWPHPRPKTALALG